MPKEIKRLEYSPIAIDHPPDETTPNGLVLTEKSITSIFELMINSRTATAEINSKQFYDFCRTVFFTLVVASFIWFKLPALH